LRATVVASLSRHSTNRIMPVPTGARSMSPDFATAAGDTIMPARSARISGKAVSGCLSRSVTWCVPVASAAATEATSALMLDRGWLRMRSRLNTAAAASNGVPSWNATSVRRSITSVLGSGKRQAVARPGTACKVLKS